MEWRMKHGCHEKSAYKFLGGKGKFPGVKMLGRYHSPGSLKGWIILETDDAEAIYKHAAEWGEYLDWEATPVVTDEQAGPGIASVYSTPN